MSVKSIPIELDKRRNLRFDLNALCVLEDEFDTPIMQLFEKMGIPTTKIEKPGKEEIEKRIRNIRLKDLRAVVWAALIHEDPKLKQENVGKHINMQNFADVLMKTMQALAGAFEADETEENSKNESGSNLDEESGTGKNS